MFQIYSLQMFDPLVKTVTG